MKRKLGERGRKRRRRKRRREEERKGGKRGNHGQFGLAWDEGKLWQTREIESEEVNGFDLSKP